PPDRQPIPPIPTRRASDLAKILAEPIHLVHALVEDCNDADISVRETAPIDEMPFVSEEISLYVELRRDGLRHDTVSFDLAESIEQSGNVPICLIGTPSFLRVAVDVVDTVRGCLLNTDSSHQARFRAITSRAVSGL